MSGDGGERLGVDGREVELSRPEKPLWPDGGPTKHDLAAYWQRIAPTALPHLRGRALTLRRFPDGIDADGFFQKSAPDWFPDWVNRVEVATGEGDLVQVTAEEAGTLVYLADQAAIELHATLSRQDRPHQPDRMILDLDPSTDDFDAVRHAARSVLALLERLDLPAFLNTTGSRGLHVVVPLRRGPDFDEVREFAHGLANYLAESEPERLTVAHRKSDRGDRVFLDYLRNAYGQTAISAYCPRALPGAPVATPIETDELDDPALEPRRWRLDNLFRRLGQKYCPWRDMDDHATALGAAREKFQRLTG